ncbi:[protein-PII] uridylyltransferase family protein [Megalodesulfovibrio paquesii]
MPTPIETLAAERKAVQALLQRPAMPPPAPGASPVAARLTAACDAYFAASLPAIAGARPACCIVAVGGYGRGECSLHADIDVLLVYPKKIPPAASELAGDLFRPLWDLRLDVGHGVRSVGDCGRIARQDMAVLASLLDLRFVAGDAGVFAALQQAVEGVLRRDVLKPFLEWLGRETTQRLARHGNAFGVLEPQLKAGEGGLREAHAARWLHRLLGARSILSERDLARMEADVGLLLEVRSRLHALSGSRQDLIALEILPELAARCGWGGTTGEPGTPVMPDESGFLACLHRAMERNRAAAWWQHRAALGKAQQDVPGDCWDLLLVCGAMGTPPSLATRRKLEAKAARPVDQAELFPRLTALLQQPQAAVAVEAMFETGLLGATLPAFGLSQDRIPYGGWHVSPVGRHSVETLRCLEALADPASEAPPRLRSLWQQEHAHQTLRWAALLHDIGKTPAEGSQGHCERGAHVASTMLAAWGAPADLVDEVAFLVREHLLLAETAHGEDPEDPAVAARIIGRGLTRARLRRLLLLTYADSRATGPRVWNDWSASLLFALADALGEALETEDPVPARQARQLQKRRELLRSQAASVYPPDVFEERLGLLDSRYLLVVTPREALRHLQLRDEFLRRFEEALIRLPGGGQEGRVAVLQARPAGREDPRADSGAWEVDVAGRCEARLLSMTSGVLALHGLDILQADVFTWKDGVALHRFFVSPPPDPLYPEEFWARVQSSLTYALSGKVRVEERLAEKRNSLFASAGKPGACNGRAAAGPVVAVAGEGEGVRVQVEADDRIGLLHDIVVGIEAAGGAVRTARIQTRGHRAHDQFHVQPPAGVPAGGVPAANLSGNETGSADFFVKHLQETLLSRLTCG